MLRFLVIVAVWVTGTAAYRVLAATPVSVTPDIILSEFGRPSADDALRLLAWLPNSNSVIVRSFGAAGKNQVDELLLVNTRSRQTTRLGSGGAPVPDPRGRFVAYLSAQGEANRAGPYTRAHLVRTDGREICVMDAVNFEKAATALDAIAWRGVEGNLLIAIAASASPVAATSSTVDGPDVKVYGAQMEAPFGPQSGDYVAIWQVDAKCGGARRIGTLPFQHTGSFIWWSTRNAILVKGYGIAPGVTHGRTDIVSMDVATGITRSVFANIGGNWYSTMALSPDEHTLAFPYDKEGLPYQRRMQIALLDLDSSRIGEISRDTRADPSWLGHSNSLLLTSLAPHVSLEHKTLWDGSDWDREISGVAGNALASPDGRSVVWIDTDLLGDSVLLSGKLHVTTRAVTVRGTTELLHRESPLSRFVRGRRLLTSCRSPDGLEVYALTVLPPAYQRRRRYPVLLQIHGGPISGLGSGGAAGLYLYDEQPGSILGTTALENDMWATLGYVVVIADYRESNMYGFKPIDDSRATGDIFEKDYMDLMCPIDALVKEGIADEARMAVLGHSWGGVLTNDVITRTDRFKAAISNEGGWASMYLDWGVMGVVNSAYSMLYGSALDYPERYERMSPIKGMTHVRTPALFIAGYEGRYPGNLYPWLLAALHERGIDAEYRVYGAEEHTIVNAANQRDVLRRSIEWISDHLR